jgi:hypothetical protein
MDDDYIKEQVAQAIYNQYRHGDNYEIVATSIPVLKLRQNMVWEDDSMARVITTVTTEKREPGPVVVVKTCHKIQEFAGEAWLPVWHIYQHGAGKPFIMMLPELPGNKLPKTVVPPPTTSGSSMPPAHDAAGIVPVWMPPKRIM